MYRFCYLDEDGVQCIDTVVFAYSTVASVRNEQPKELIVFETLQQMSENLGKRCVLPTKYSFEFLATAASTGYIDLRTEGCISIHDKNDIHNKGGV